MLIQKGSPFPNLSAFTTYLQASTVQTQMTSDPKAKFPSHHAPPAGREAGPFCNNPLLPETFPRTRRCSEPAAARASPRQTTHTLPPTSPRQSSDPYLPPQRTNLSPKHKWGNFKRDHRAAPSQTPRPARTGGLARGRTPRFAKLERWTEQRLRGPLGTPSTFREERCDAAGSPPPPRWRAPGGGPRRSLPTAPRRRRRHRARSPRARPGAPRPHRAPPRPSVSPRAPPSPARAPRPASPRPPEPRGRPSSAVPLPRPATPHPSAPHLSATRPPPQPPPPPPPHPRSPQPPHRVSAPAGGRAHAAAPARPATALRAARSRLLQPGTRRDIRARIPTPGLFLGVRPRPDRNSFFAARVRTERAPRCPSAGLASPFLSASSLSSPSRSPLRAGFSSRWVLTGLPWARRGCRQGESRRLHSYRRSTRAWGGGGGRRTMFFRVGETTDHPAQEGDDGGLAPGPQAGALFPLKDRVLLEGILVT